MIDINKEAEEYADYSNDYVPLSFGNKFNENTKRTFIAGINSKYVQAKIIQAQIEENNSILEMLKMHGNDRCIYVIRERIINLEQQLNNLKNEI